MKQYLGAEIACHRLRDYPAQFWLPIVLVSYKVNLRFCTSTTRSTYGSSVVKCRLRGEAHLVRYIGDFVICFQYRSDALRLQEALRLRLGKFGLTLEPTEIKLVEFGRFAQRDAGKRGRNAQKTRNCAGYRYRWRPDLSEH